MYLITKVGIYVGCGVGPEPDPLPFADTRLFTLTLL